MRLTLPGTSLTLARTGAAGGGAPDVRGDRVIVRATARADLFLDPAGSSSPAPDAERFMTSVSGDFVFGGHVAAGFTAPYDSGVLLVAIDDTNWFKVCSELDPHGVTRVVSVVTRHGRSDDANAWQIPPTGAHLRVARCGATAALHASADGVRWDLIRYFDPGFTSPVVQVGILAQSPAGDGTTATFSDMFFRPETLANVRDGS